MRRFLIGCLAIVGTLSLLAFLVIGGAIYSLVRHVTPMIEASAPVPSKPTVLTLTLSGGLSDGRGDDPIAALLDSSTPKLREVIDTIDRAATDPLVRGLLVDLGAASPSFTQSQEVAAAIRRFRAAGKRAIAVADTLDEGASSAQKLVLASAFEQIWLQPSGAVGTAGLRLERPFFPGTLDKIGVEPQFDQRREFKGGVDSFVDRKFSPPLRASLQALIDDLHGQTTKAVAAGRGLSEDEAKQLLAKTPMPAEEALSARLIDGIGYRRDVLAKLMQVAEAQETESFQDYADAIGEPPDGAARIAVIYGIGPVVRSAPDGAFAERGTMAADAISRAFREASEDPKVRAIVFRIDSPGGSYVASDTIWQAVHDARRAGKKVVASLGSVAASGGYFAAMACDRIVAGEATLTGSIGVYSGKFVLSGMWSKLGVDWDGVETLPNAGMYSPNRPFSKEEWAMFQRDLDRVYTDFTGRVVRDRAIPATDIEQVAGGRVFTGRQAVALKLADVTGDFPVALAEARRIAGIGADETLELVTYPKSRDVASELLHKLRHMGVAIDHTAALAGIAARIAPALERSLTDGDHALMAPITPDDLR